MSQQEQTRPADPESAEVAPAARPSRLWKVLLLALMLAAAGALAFVGRGYLRTRAKHRPPPPAVLVSLLEEPGTFNLSSPDQYVVLAVDLEVRGENSAAKVQEAGPKLKDALIKTLSGYNLGQIVGEQGKTSLAQTLVKRFNEVLGKDLVRNVYFTSLVTQKI